MAARFNNPSVALVHHHLGGYRGGERVLEAFCELFPDAPIHTLFASRRHLPESLRRKDLVTSWFDRIPGIKRIYKGLLPLMPMAFERFDLHGFDLVMTSDAMLAKGVVTGAETLHVCYCHSPPRYLWDLAPDYRSREVPRGGRLLWDAVTPWLRVYDFVAAQRVDHFIANSTIVQQRIKKHYGRDAEIIFPPVDTEYFRPSGHLDRSEEYLYVGEMIPYKRPDLLVEAFRGSGRRLRLVGSGPLVKPLRRNAPPNVSVEGFLPPGALLNALQTCRAFVFAGLEDFGISLVEAQACGAPVIAYGRGGALDTVRPGLNGVLFDRADVDGVREAVDRFEQQTFDPQKIRQHAEGFSQEHFLDRMAQTLKSLGV